MIRPVKTIKQVRVSDIEDRDTLLRQIANVVRGQLFEKDGRPDLAVIDDAIEAALDAIGDTARVVSAAA
jgi:hypothetical protein